MITSVFLDLDGTLLSHATGRVPQSAIGALAGLRDRGIRVFLASGRHYLELADLPLAGVTFDGMVLANGSVCMDGSGSVFFGEMLPQESVKAMLDEVERDPFPCWVLEPKDTYINYVDESVLQGQAAVQSPPMPVGDITRALGRDVCMIVAFMEEPRMLAFAKSRPELLVTSWAPGCFDVVCARAGKDRGIRETLRHFGLAGDEVLAIGDGPNDCAMLRAATYGVAMGNGHEACKAAADFVTGDIDEDGLCKALAHYGLL